MSETITDAVKSKYGSVATSGLSSPQRGSEGRGRGVRLHARRAGLDSRRGEHGAVVRQSRPPSPPSGAGEVVVDLGSGGGLDVLLAARRSVPRVGPSAST